MYSKLYSEIYKKKKKKKKPHKPKTVYVKQRNYPIRKWYTEFHAKEFYVTHKIGVVKEQLITCKDI